MQKIKKIRPYLSAQFDIIKRKTYELFGYDKFSKPYPDHDKLLKYLDDKKNGFFVLGGGNDGYNVDPTYYLERFRNWTGIIIEPTKIKKYCKFNRPKSIIHDVALVSSDFTEANLTLIDCNAMSVVKNSFTGYEDWVKAGEQAQRIKAKEITVSVSTLDSILDKYFSTHPAKQIDLIILDLEGYELEALRGLSLDKYRPEFLLIEIHTLDRKREVEDYLNDKYRLVDIFDSNDHLYKRL